MLLIKNHSVINNSLIPTTGIHTYISSSNIKIFVKELLILDPVTGENSLKHSQKLNYLYKLAGYHNQHLFNSKFKYLNKIDKLKLLLEDTLVSDKALMINYVWQNEISNYLEFTSVIKPCLEKLKIDDDFKILNPLIGLNNDQIIHLVESITSTKDEFFMAMNRMVLSIILESSLFTKKYNKKYFSVISFADLIQLLKQSSLKDLLRMVIEVDLEKYSHIYDIEHMLKLQVHKDYLVKELFQLVEKDSDYYKKVMSSLFIALEDVSWIK